MKMLFKTFLSIFILVALFGCNEQKVEYKQNTAKPHSTPKPKSTIKHDGASKHFSFLDNELFKNIDIENLDSKQVELDQTEIRIIFFGGIFYPSVFVYDKKNDTKQAYSIRFNATQKESAKLKKVSLPQPKSGWKNFDSFLLENGIKYPLNWKTVKKSSSHIDETFTILEIRKGNDYDFRLYSSGDETDDYKKIRQILNEIRKQFQID